MNDIKQAEIYLRVLWLNDNENLRPDSINIKLDGEITEEVVFSISREDNNIGINNLWETIEWTNGITYNYQKKTQEVSDEEEQVEISSVPYVIPSVVDVPDNYRCNILKNAETEEYSYYTIKMTYILPKRRKAARSTTPVLNFNGTTIENVNFNGTEVDKVVFNDIIVFEKVKGLIFADAVLANSTVNEEMPNFKVTATTDEGIFFTEDNDGTSYYFRGAVENNYVLFGGFWWRIIRINGDGTIRLIYDGTSSHVNGIKTSDCIIGTADSYNKQTDRSEYVGWTYVIGKQRPQIEDTITSCNAKIKLEEWYNSNLKPYENKIANGKFYNDRSIIESNWESQSDFRITYSTEYRYTKSYLPTLLNSQEDLYILKVGFLTIDEIMFAGGKYLTANKSYYLYNRPYWTMSPGHYSGNSSVGFRWAYVYYLSSTYFGTTSSVAATSGIRPVINLKSNVKVTGTGTINDPYVVI